MSGVWLPWPGKRIAVTRLTLVRVCAASHVWSGRTPRVGGKPRAGWGGAIGPHAVVVLFCRQRRYLSARVALDEARLASLAPGLDPAEVHTHLDAAARVAVGDADAGPVARLEQSERFHWIVAPSSTMIQTSPVHTGLCEDPEATLERLMGSLVAL